MTAAQKNSFDFIVVGNNIASLVAAAELGKKGSVALYNPTPSWGGHFAGTNIDGNKYDLGMNFLEFTTFKEKSNDVRTYDPAVKNDCARFFHIIEKYIGELVTVREVPAPKMFVAGTLLDDILIANHFDAIAKLPAAVRSAAINELQSGESNGKLHASRKNAEEELFIETSYEEVSLANHGQTFHNLFIEPLCQRVLNISSSKIPALFHRVAWGPLFYPETLLAFLQGGNVNLPRTLFHYPVNGYFSAVTEALMEKLKANNNVTLLQGKPVQISQAAPFRIEIESNTPIQADQLIWTMDTGQYLKLTGQQGAETLDKASLALVFLALPKQSVTMDFSALNVLEDFTAVYRLTNQTASAGANGMDVRMVAEINCDYFAGKFGPATEETLLEHTLTSLKRMNLITGEAGVTHSKTKILQNVLNLPTLDNYRRFQSMQKKVREAGQRGLHLLGQASGFASASFNDQVVQGLKIGMTI